MTRAGTYSLVPRMNMNVRRWRSQKRRRER
jgi:hypothetical protein